MNHARILALRAYHGRMRATAIGVVLALVLTAGGTAICGRLGEDLEKAAGYEAARRTAMVMLATLRERFGSLDGIRRLIKTTGFVQATPQFKDHPAVINGFSELMRDVFGPEAGVGARSAMGVASLPAGWAVEIEAVRPVRERGDIV